jgi:hypothetical protein
VGGGSFAAKAAFREVAMTPSGKSIELRKLRAPEVANSFGDFGTCSGKLCAKCFTALNTGSRSSNENEDAHSNMIDMQLNLSKTLSRLGPIISDTQIMATSE